jgi:hypothetical protein
MLEAPSSEQGGGAAMTCRRTAAGTPRPAIT